MRITQPAPARRIALGIALTAAILMSTPNIAVATDVSTQTVCGQSMNAVVNGGKAYWRANCSGSNMTVSGWVRDTAADGMCARVKALMSGSWKYSPRACPSGTTKHFDLYGVDNDAQVYLYLEP